MTKKGLPTKARLRKKTDRKSEIVRGSEIGGMREIR